MNGSELFDILSSLKETSICFKGCYMNNNIDIFMFLKDSNCFFIMNSKVNPNIMGHWVLFFIKRHSLYFVDSFGRSPISYGGVICEFFSKYEQDKHIIFSKQMQSSSSFVCGLYTITCAYIIAKDGPELIHHLFSHKSKDKNDCFVKCFVFKISGYVYRYIL